MYMLCQHALVNISSLSPVCVCAPLISWFLSAIMCHAITCLGSEAERVQDEDLGVCRVSHVLCGSQPVSPAGLLHRRQADGCVAHAQLLCCMLLLSIWLWRLHVKLHSIYTLYIPGYFWGCKFS